MSDSGVKRDTVLCLDLHDLIAPMICKSQVDCWHGHARRDSFRKPSRHF